MNEKRVYVAACGVCCGVCGLCLKGICLPCGLGLERDEEVVEKKMVEQIRNLGHVCSILQCVVDKGIGYCMRDCSQFPCKLYEEYRFPYSEGFLQMYKARYK